MNTVLQVKNLSKFFGGVKANQDISIDVPEKKIIGLIQEDLNKKQPWQEQLMFN